MQLIDPWVPTVVNSLSLLAALAFLCVIVESWRRLRLVRFRELERRVECLECGREAHAPACKGQCCNEQSKEGKDKCC